MEGLMAWDNILTGLRGERFKMLAAVASGQVKPIFMGGKKPPSAIRRLVVVRRTRNGRVRVGDA